MFYVTHFMNLNDPTEGVVYEIRTAPSRGNSGSRPEIIEGWLGTTNNIYRFAHGAFETIEAAREMIDTHAGGAYPWDGEASGDPDVVESWGDRTATAEVWDAAEWLQDVRGEIRSRLANGETVDALVEEFETSANAPDPERPAGIILTGTREFIRDIAAEME